MLLDIIAGLLGSQLLRAVAFDVATTLLCQVVQHTVTTAARPRPASRTDRSDDGSAPTDSVPSAPTSGPTPQEAGPPPLRTLPRVEIVSSVAGRVRLRVPGVRGDAARAAEVAAMVRDLAGVTSAQASARTGTLLVHFDPTELSAATIVAALESPTPARPRAATRVPYLRLVVG